MKEKKIQSKQVKMLFFLQTLWKEHTLFLFIIFIGIAFRLWNIAWGLPDLYEEAMPLTIAWKFWNGNSAGFNFHPDFFVYPAFTFYLEFFIQIIVYGIGYLFGIYTDVHSFLQAFATIIQFGKIFFASYFVFSFRIE